MTMQYSDLGPDQLRDAVALHAPTSKDEMSSSCHHQKPTYQKSSVNAGFLMAGAKGFEPEYERVRNMAKMSEIAFKHWPSSRFSRCQ